jgi:outer membrane protein TolC
VIVSGVISVGGVALACAQEGCLSLAQVREAAAREAPSVALAQARADEAEAALDATRSVRRPQVSAFARTSAGDTGLTDSAIENQIGLRASIRVYDFGASRLSREAEEARLAARGAGLEDAALQAGLEAAFDGLAVLQAQAQLQATARRVDYFRAQEAAVSSLLAQGGATRSDLAEIRAEIGSAEAALEELRFQRDRAQTRLAIATQSDMPVCEGAEANLEDVLAMAAGARGTDALVEAALTNRPALTELREEADGLQADAARTRRARLPAIDLVGIASYTYDDARDEFEYRDRLGVDVSVPLLTGSSLEAQSRSASARASQAQARLRDAERETREEITTGLRRLVALEAQRLRRDEVAELKAEQFAAAEAERAAGLKTLPELIEVRVESEGAVLDAISARFDLARERLRTLALIGDAALAVQLESDEP